jgi:hypothetical protein
MAWLRLWLAARRAVLARRLAYGCNIGAYFSGIASSSVHGWAWLGMALLGTVVGIRLRPLFGLTVERTRNSEA